jgi:hypothetical protein
MWIPWIRIRIQIWNTGTYIFFSKWSKLCTANLMGPNFIKKKFKIIIFDPVFGSFKNMTFLSFNAFSRGYLFYIVAHAIKAGFPIIQMLP